MQIDDDPGGRYPVQDFVKHSETLKRLDWTNRTMAVLIRAGYLGGVRDRVSGMYFTSKAEIIDALKVSNRLGKVPKTDIKEAEKTISASSIVYSKRKQRSGTN